MRSVENEECGKCGVKKIYKRKRLYIYIYINIVRGKNLI